MFIIKKRDGWYGEKKKKYERKAFSTCIIYVMMAAILKHFTTTSLHIIHNILLFRIDAFAVKKIYQTRKSNRIEFSIK